MCLKGTVSAIGVDDGDYMKRSKGMYKEMMEMLSLLKERARWNGDRSMHGMIVSCIERFEDYFGQNLLR